MVSILPSERSPFDVISKDVGRALQGVLPNAVQQGYQRGQGLGAIDQLQEALGAAGGDINKILPALAKAYTMNPGLERSGLGQQFLQQAQRQQGSKEFPTGHPKRQGEQQGQEVPVAVGDLVQPRPSMVTNPQGVQDFQLPFGPDEIANIRQQSRQQGYTPEMEERFVNDAKEYNQGAQAKREYELNNYAQQQQQRRDTLENQNLFNKYMENNAKELWENPDDRELAIQAAGKILNDPKTKDKSFTDVLGKVKDELRPYQAAKKALDRSLQRPLFGQTKEQRALSRPRAQMMVKMGQKPQLQLMIAKNGHGEVEEADLLNPLPESFENNLNKFGKVLDPLNFVSNIDPESPEYQEQFARGQERFQNQKTYLSNFLADNMTSGTYNAPGTNLILTRKNLMDKGLSWDDAAKVIDEAINKGKLKLDPQQQIDHQKLSIPPLTGDSYLDTIMNNIMFPITGKE